MATVRRNFGVLLLEVIWLCSNKCAGKTIYARRTLTKIVGEKALLECQLVDAVLKKTGGQANYVAKLEWTKTGAVVASYSKGEEGAEWWVASSRYELDRGNFSLTILETNAADSSIFVCNPTFDRNVDWISLPTEEPEYVRLDVITVPTEPGRVRVTSYTARSASLTWEESRSHPDYPVNQYLVTVSVKNGRKWDKYKTLTVEENHVIVPSLKPYTTYAFQAVAESTVGMSRPGQKSAPVTTKGERPAEAPKILSVHNATNTSLVVTWEAPPKRSLHGPLIGYRIMTHELRTGKRREVYIGGPDVKSKELKGLKVFTKYLISLEADNNYGYSPAATTVVITEEGVPSSGPVISSLNVISSRDIEVTWAPPRKPNGRVTHYTLYYRAANEKMHEWDFVPAEEFGGVVSKTIQGLEPYRKYYVWVTASTKRGEGVPSETTFAYTDTDAPTAPILANISVEGLRTVSVEWLKPRTVHRRVDSYMIKLRSSEKSRHPEANRERIINTTEPYVYFTSVILNQRYRMQVTGLTRSIVQSKKSYLGPPSKPEAFLLKEGDSNSENGKTLTLYTTLCSTAEKTIQQDKEKDWAKEVKIVCDPELLANPRTENIENKGGSVVIVSVMSLIGVLIFLGICLFIAFLFYRRKKGDTYVTDAFVPVETHYDPYDESEFPSISVTMFPTAVEQLHADGDSGFAREYENLDMEIQELEDKGELAAEHSILSCNKPKNRYINIHAYDHSRVVLRQPSDSKCNDYINANFVDRKCDQYWPSEGSEIYGEQFEIRLLNEYQTAFYSVRMMSIKNLKAKTVRTVERLVFQYHYTHWPDHGVPYSPLPALTFIRKSAAANRDSAGPMVVHCSAGVGRSGTYIVIDSMLRQIKARKNVNVYAYLRHIRRQRSYLVQTEEQYIFCYEAILEAIRSGNTEIGSSDLHDYVDNCLMMEENEQSKTFLLQSQYDLIVRQPSLTCNTGKLSYNVPKNRHPDILPADDFRVTISSKATVQGSDYVNASFFQGFHKLDEFIVTQTPIENTVRDFWEMVFDHNCQTLVLLSDIDNIFFKQFWPDLDGGNLEYTTFYVYTTDETSGEDWACVDLILQSREDDFQLPCRLLHYPGWPQQCPTLKNVWELVQTVQDWHLEYQDGPVMVIDKYGGNPAATFCALSTLACQMELESSVDVYQVAKMYHARRPGVFPTCGDYRYLYDCLLCLLKTEGRTDENFNESDRSAICRNGTAPSKFRLSFSVPNGLKRSATRNSTESTGASNSKPGSDRGDSPKCLMILDQNGGSKIARDTTL